MSTVEGSIFDDLDRFCFAISDTMEKPLNWAYGVFYERIVSPLDCNGLAGTVQEVATRVFLGLIGVVGGTFVGNLLAVVVLKGGSTVFRALGVALQKNGFTQIDGSLPEKVLENGEASAMTVDIRNSRDIDEIVKNIQAENPDILVLQGVNSALVEKIIDKLGDQYAHFFTHLGATTWKGEDGCLIATKCAVHHFSYASFFHCDRMENHGFSTLEIRANPQDLVPCARIIGADFARGEVGKERRIEQLGQVVNALAEQKLALPTLFAGSFNANQNNRDEKLLSKYLAYGYRGQTSPLVPQKMHNLISLFRYQQLPDGRSLSVIEKGICFIEGHAAENLYSSLFVKLSGLTPQPA